MQAAPFPVSPGEVLAGKYRIERLLGMGGMGVVVAARHLDLGELFALKFLLPQAVSNAQAVDRFVREARAAARLRGEHVAKVTDVGRLENGAPYMVMEYLQGTDLHKHVRERGPLPPDVAVTYLLQVCDAIAEAHSAGIIHRDLKPANLFLTTRPNGTPCIKVLDFGISKQVTPDAVELTRTGNVLGSPLYMAPEQMARTKDADARSDIWSMGIVLYELCTGTVPFLAETITEVVARVLQEEPVPPSHVRPGISPGLDAVVARCLQKRPDQRFQNIHELAAALRSLSHDPRQSLPGPSATLALPSSAITSPGQSQSLRASAPTPPPQPLVAAVRTESSWGTTGGNPGPSAAPAKRSSVGLFLALGAVVFLGLAGTGGYLALRSNPGVGSPASDTGAATSQSAVAPAPTVAPEPLPTASATAEPSVQPASEPQPPKTTAAATTTPPPATARPGAPVAPRPQAVASPPRTSTAPAPTPSPSGPKKREGVW